MPKKIYVEPSQRGARLEVVQGGTGERVTMRSREREAVRFAEKMGDVRQVSRDTTRGVSGDAPLWAKVVSQPGYNPNVFQFPGWEKWSAENTARNFAIVHDVAHQAGLDRATAGALTASMFFTSEMRAGMIACGTVKKMEVLPRPEDGTFALSFEYDNQGDVRQPKISPKAEKIGLEYNPDELDEFRMPGLEGDTVHKQTLAVGLKKERGSLAYDEQTQSFLVSHYIEKDGLLAVVPGEMIGAEEYLTPVEHRLVQNAGKHRNEWVDLFTNDKAKGWETTDFASLQAVKPGRKNLDNLRDNASELADEAAAERIQTTAATVVETLVDGYRSRWAEQTLATAKKNLKMTMEYEPASLGKLLKGLVGRGERKDPEQYEAQMKAAIQQLADRLPVQTNVDTRWMRRLESLEKGKERIEARLEIRLSLPLNMPDALSVISDPRPGKGDKPLHVGDHFGSAEYTRTITAPIETRRDKKE